MLTSKVGNRNSKIPNATVFLPSFLALKAIN